MGGRADTTKTMNPWKLTDNVTATLLQLAEEGSTGADAAAMAGIDRHTLWRWLNEPNPSEQLAQFQTDWETARARGRDRLVKLLHRHAEQDWRAGAWVLERTDPDNWAKSDIDPEKFQAKLAALIAELTADDRPDRLPELTTGT